MSTKKKDLPAVAVEETVQGQAELAWKILLR